MHDATIRGASAPSERAHTPIRPDFVFVCDPGHAWLMVGDDDIAAIDLTAADFTIYSKRSPAGQVALEEDVDAPRFIAAWEAVHGRLMNVADYPVDGDARCRSWPRYGAAEYN
jgi:hypothetical protein